MSAENVAHIKGNYCVFEKVEIGPMHVCLRRNKYGV